ncbi:la-related protein 6 [Parasteatoda tepidariorum]|uniref:la-related protein 6 n=1 Tax=Parasteatoda tepidariorum TaxID=114398 RepID=UPI00077FB560|nr:la-related protein 6 [Parasteatoda tepidariorum]
MSIEIVPVTISNDMDDDSSCGNHSEEGGLNFSDTDPKDSGIDCADPEDMPGEEIASAIMKTVEYYLSDANILRDPFLLKHVRRNKEGYVSLKLLASFRKVRSLSRNWKAVAYSLQKSTQLALNSEGTKVKRLTPLPDHDESPVSRSIIVHGFSTDKPSVDSISEMFSHCGDIALVRILRPGGSIPSDVKHFLAKNSDIQSKVSALVEFEEHSAAKRALESDLPGDIKVTSIVLKEKSENTDPKSSPAKEKKKKKNRKSSNADSSTTLNDNRRSSSGSVSSGYLSSSPYNTNPFDNRYPRRHSYHIYNDPNSSFASLSNRHGGSRDRLLRSDIMSPWRRRREQSDSNLLSSVSSACQLLQGVPVKTIRMPKGPDGTNGFCPKFRSRLPSTAE